MNNEKETISKEEAAETLKSVDLTKRDAIKSFRIPLLLITLISLLSGNEGIPLKPLFSWVSGLQFSRANF